MIRKESAANYDVSKFWKAPVSITFLVPRKSTNFLVLEKAVQKASGVAKQGRSDSLSILNVKHPRSDSLPVTPLMARKASRTPPKLILPEPKKEQYREVPAESVFTPAPTRPAPMIRFPVGDDDDSSESGSIRFELPPYRHASTLPVFSTDTLVKASKISARKISLDGRQESAIRKRTVYGPISRPISISSNGRIEGIVRLALENHQTSISSASSFESDLEKPGIAHRIEPVGT